MPGRSAAALSLLLTLSACTERGRPPAAPDQTAPPLGGTTGSGPSKPDAGGGEDAGSECSGADGNTLRFVGVGMDAGARGGGALGQARWDTRMCTNPTLQILLTEGCAATGDVLVISITRDALEGSLLLVSEVEVFRGDFSISVTLNDSGAPLAGPWVPCGSQPLVLNLAQFGVDKGSRVIGTLKGPLSECDAQGVASNTREVDATFDVTIPQSFEEACRP